MTALIVFLWIANMLVDTGGQLFFKEMCIRDRDEEADDVKTLHPPTPAGA